MLMPHPIAVALAGATNALATRVNKTIHIRTVDRA
jgi:hypothetical protein